MGYDDELAARVRGEVSGRSGITERKMFGGLAFMLDGHMFCGVIEDDLMVRIGVEEAESALAQPHTRPMDFTGRPLKGYVFVAPAGSRALRLSERGSSGPRSSRPRRRRSRRARDGTGLSRAPDG
jgi:TfoX N-terminal domain